MIRGLLSRSYDAKYDPTSDHQRTYVRQQSPLILGEPTTHLDEAAVVGSIGNLTTTVERSAILVIIYDPSVLSKAQRTCVLRDGRIVDTQLSPALAEARQVDGAPARAAEKVIDAYGAS